MLFLGHPAYLCPGPLDLAMSPPGEQKCRHLYFIGETVCSWPWPSFSRPSASACSLGCFSSRESSLYPQAPVQGEEAWLLISHSGQFPSGDQSPGIGAHLLWTQHLPWQQSQEKEQWHPAHCTFKVRQRQGVAAEATLLFYRAWFRFTGLVKPYLESHVHCWASHSHPLQLNRLGGEWK